MEARAKRARGPNDGKAVAEAEIVSAMNQSATQKTAHVASVQHHDVRDIRLPAAVSADVAARTSATAIHCAAVHGRPSPNV